MKFSFFGHLFHKQAGFSMMELAVALLITSILGLGASFSSAQILNQTTRDRDHTVASRQTENAIFWIGRDALMSQQIDGAAGFPLTANLLLSWKSWDNKTYSSEYSIQDGVLWRTFTEGTSVTATRIAININTDEDKTFCSFVDGVLTLTVTSTTGEGYRTINVTKETEICSRPKL
jgi:prepilin-type N-terminal cleavage/methylation domain-containing protein